MLGNSSVAVEVAASQEGLIPMQLVRHADKETVPLKHAFRIRALKYFPT
jgi:hypothetical protein